MMLFSLKTAILFASPIAAVSTKYTFEDYVTQYRKSYSSNAEKVKRKAIFEKNMAKIEDHYSSSARSGTTYTLGINHMMDLENPPMGYDKSVKRQLDAIMAAKTSRRRHLRLWEEMLDSDYSLVVEEVSALPSRIDWRSVSTPVKDQGMCGSCWAFASTAVLESHVAIQTDTLFSLSVQELVSCTPNAKECGGNGGCTGSIAQLAYDYVERHGILEEWQFGYNSYHGANIECSFNVSKDENLPQAVATIDGYATLPQNNYTVLMNAVAKLGPIAVSVAASDWALYSGGVFSHALNSTTSTDINHLVVLVGYGTDEETKQDYWLVRNSWSPRWGEGGYIRLLREEFPECGVDTTPGDGDACKKDDNGNPIVPPAEKICGTSGILYQGVVPFGGRLL